MRLAWMLALATGSAAIAAPPAKTMIVVCSPGAIGTQADAQPALDSFTGAVGAKAGLPLGAVFEQTEAGGVAQIKNASMALVSLPFFLAHEKELDLHARLTGVLQGRPALDRWTLVAKKGRVPNAAALAGMTIYGNTAFAPAFVRGTVLGSFGAVPASTKLVQSTSVLSALRKAANGEPVAVLLDGTQEASLATLPYAAQLDEVAKSPPAPAGLLATVGSRVPPQQLTAIEKAFQTVATDQLAAVHLEKFAPLDEAALDAARKAYEAAPK